MVLKKETSCPYCFSLDSIIKERRDYDYYIRRRYECKSCYKTFAIYEGYENYYKYKEKYEKLLDKLKELK